jgi:hypothetical protein
VEIGGSNPPGVAISFSGERFFDIGIYNMAQSDIILHGVGLFNGAVIFNSIKIGGYKHGTWIHGKGSVGGPFPKRA